MSYGVKVRVWSSGGGDITLYRDRRVVADERPRAEQDADALTLLDEVVRDVRRVLLGEEAADGDAGRLAAYGWMRETLHGIAQVAGVVAPYLPDGSERNAAWGAELVERVRRFPAERESLDGGVRVLIDSALTVSSIFGLGRPDVSGDLRSWALAMRERAIAYVDAATSPPLPSVETLASMLWEVRGDAVPRADRRPLPDQEAFVRNSWIKTAELLAVRLREFAGTAADVSPALSLTPEQLAETVQNAYGFADFTPWSELSDGERRDAVKGASVLLESLRTLPRPPVSRADVDAYAAKHDLVLVSRKVFAMADPAREVPRAAGPLREGSIRVASDTTALENELLAFDPGTTFTQDDEGRLVSLRMGDAGVPVTLDANQPYGSFSLRASRPLGDITPGGPLDPGTSTTVAEIARALRDFDRAVPQTRHAEVTTLPKRIGDLVEEVRRLRREAEDRTTSLANALKFSPEDLRALFRSGDDGFRWRSLTSAVVQLVEDGRGTRRLLDAVPEVAHLREDSVQHTVARVLERLMVLEAQVAEQAGVAPPVAEQAGVAPPVADMTAMAVRSGVTDDTSSDPVPVFDGTAERASEGSVEERRVALRERYGVVLSLVGENREVFPVGSSLPDSVFAVRSLDDLDREGDRPLDVLYVRGEGGGWVSRGRNGSRALRTPEQLAIVPLVDCSAEVRYSLEEFGDAYRVMDRVTGKPVRGLVLYTKQGYQSGRSRVADMNAPARPAFLDCDHGSSDNDDRCRTCGFPLA